MSNKILQQTQKSGFSKSQFNLLQRLVKTQRLRGNSPFSQMVSFNLTIGAVELHHLSQCLDPADDLDNVFFHPELAVHVYTDGSRDDYYRSASGIYIKSQDHILRIQWKNPDGCSVFRSELIAIDEALGPLASLPNGKEIWMLSYSRSAIQHLSNWQSAASPVHIIECLRSPQAEFSRRSLAAPGLFEIVRCRGPGLALLTDGGEQQQKHSDKILSAKMTD
ncbi:uncharacterized protein TNCV_4489881 [Trichonephila clavipes]|nr:uncharacterized protein TNCV_4489881 [Trichonephila clavipes]